MSTRQLLNIGIGSVALLLVAAVGVVWTSLGDQEADQARVDLAAGQQVLVQGIASEVANLEAAGNLMEVGKAREDLGSTILAFDRNLNALIHGGRVADSEGRDLEIQAAEGDAAKAALADAAELWVQTGMPLADLAAGEFSIFSSAGQGAVAGLRDNGSEIMNQMGVAATAMGEAATVRQARGRMARWFSLGLTGAFIGLGVVRFRRPGAAAAAPPRQPLAPSNPTVAETTISHEAAPTPAPADRPARIWDRPVGEKYVSPVDFDNVNASVDQLSVDMNTIATSTDKMRLAIDSVGHAMQGMLFSLNQMAQDSAEGYKIVRGANNAATYTGGAAGELAESAQEMSRVVARVTQLAMKSKQVATQIEAEAVATGSTGEAFTSVVAGEVKGLAGQTSQATAQIEQTVAEILGTARQYEEAIGQILKNIGAINKVSENLGELMLHPPSAGVAGTPLPGTQSMPLAPPAPAPAPAPAPPPVAAVDPVPAPPHVAPEDDLMIGGGDLDDADWGNDDDPEPAEPTAEETAEVIEDTAADEPAGSNANVFMLGGGTKKTRRTPKPAPEPAPEPEAKAEPPAAEADDGDANIFMLNKPKKKAEDAPEAAAPAPEPEPEPEPAPEPEAAAEPAAEAEDDGGANIFMLNKPKNAGSAPQAEAPAPEPEPAPEPAPEPEAAAEPEAEEEDDGGTNIFMLNKPKKKADAAPAAEAPAPEPEPEPVTIGGDGDDGEAPEGKGGEGGSDGNIFMLNKKK